MITLRAGRLSQPQDFLETVKVFLLAESLGGVESLIEHRPNDTRQCRGESSRLELVPVSFGLVLVLRIERSSQDLENALERALSWEFEGLFLTLRSAVKRLRSLHIVGFNHRSN